MGVTGVGCHSSELQTKSQIRCSGGGGGAWRLWLCYCCYWPFGQSISQVCCFLRNTTAKKVSMASNKSRHGSQKVLPSCLIVRRWGSPTVLPSCHFAKVVLFPFFWKYTEAARISTYVFDVDVNLFTEDARVACAAVSRSVSLRYSLILTGCEPFSLFYEIIDNLFLCDNVLHKLEILYSS